jgi:hypothetical protein
LSLVEAVLFLMFVLDLQFSIFIWKIMAKYIYPAIFTCEKKLGQGF